MLDSRQRGDGQHQQQLQQQAGHDRRQLNAGGRASLNGHNEPNSKQQIANLSPAKPTGAKGSESPASGRQLSASEASCQPASPELPVDFGCSSSSNGNERDQSQQSASSRLRLLEHQQLRGQLINQQQQQQQRPRKFNEEKEPDERSKFIKKNWQVNGQGEARKELRARLAQQESITATEQNPGESAALAKRGATLDYVQRGTKARSRSKKREAEAEAGGCWFSMLRALRARRYLIVAIVILVIYIAAIYCLPTVEINPDVPSQLPAIPFDFQDGPLRPSSASAFKFKHLFKDQIHGPESLAFDSMGNLFMAIEGGFILYAHLNKSSPMRRAFQELASSRFASQTFQQQQQQQVDSAKWMAPELIKIAELNGMRPVAENTRRRGSRMDPDSMWRRECQLDEKVYGNQLFVNDKTQGFKSKVLISRCSKPLGIRLNSDETQLYVIDTLAGLFKVDLRQALDSGQRQSRLSGQRQVLKLIDFRANNGYLELPAVQLEDEPEPNELPSNNVAAAASEQQQSGWIQPATRLMNISMKALDDLVIDRSKDGAHDLIYMTVASQSWPATSFVFDALEGRPSGRILRYNTGNNQLVVLEPDRVALVRTSALRQQQLSRLDLEEMRHNVTLFADRSYQPSFLLGAPRMDENDLFDNRPLNFPNGLELTDDRQALLIADTTNKRILKHHIRGPRRGTTDLWAWTPMYPDNIRRGRDKQQETYWVVGCGRAKSSSSVEEWLHYDPFEMLRTWPQVRKFLLKNIYLMGYLFELVGENLLQSTRVQDFGYGLRTGSSLCQSGCPGMMIIQYNKYGDIIKSIHSREFPNDLYYYSQVNEFIDPESQEHSLYLGSPSYSYLTKLTLPSESQVDTTNHQANSNYHRDKQSMAMLGDDIVDNQLSGGLNQINNDYNIR